MRKQMYVDELKKFYEEGEWEDLEKAKDMRDKFSIFMEVRI